jgi:hypothetical protein
MTDNVDGLYNAGDAGESQTMDKLGEWAESNMVDSVHGSGELGQADARAVEEGFADIEDKEAAKKARIEAAEGELGRKLEPEEVDDLIDELVADKTQSAEEGSESDEEGHEADEGGDTPADSEARSYDYEDIISALGEDAMVKVKIRGEDVDVPVSDLIGGYSRTQDYSRKTQELAEERRALADEFTEVRTSQQEYMQRLAMADRLLEQTGTPEQVNQIRQEFARVTQEAARQDITVQAETLAAEADLLISKIPAWQEDRSVASAERDTMLNYAVEQGYTPEMLEQITDHRALLLLYKAMKYDEIGSARDVVRGKIKKAKMLKPGHRASDKSLVKAQSKKAKQQSRARLRATGSKDDAHAALMDFLGDDDL